MRAGRLIILSSLKIFLLKWSEVVFYSNNLLIIIIFLSFKIVDWACFIREDVRIVVVVLFVLPPTHVLSFSTLNGYCCMNEHVCTHFLRNVMWYVIYYADDNDDLKSYWSRPSFYLSYKYKQKSHTLSPFHTISSISIIKHSVNLDFVKYTYIYIIYTLFHFSFWAGCLYLNCIGFLCLLCLSVFADLLLGTNLTIKFAQTLSLSSAILNMNRCRKSGIIQRKQ